MSEPALVAAGAASPDADPAVEELAHALGLDPARAQRLVIAGLRTAAQVREATPNALADAGLEPAEIERIRSMLEAQRAEPPALTEPPMVGRPAVDGDKIVGRWLESVRKADRPKRRHLNLPAKDSTDVLKKWVEGDDRAMENWIQASDANRTGRASGALPTVIPPQAPTPAQEGVPAPISSETGTSTPAPLGLIPSQLLEREETVVHWLTGLLDRVKSDHFDPQSLLQESQELQRTLFEERAKRKQLEDQIEHVKRGSIAVIKYVRSRESRAREQAIQTKDAEIAELRLRLLQSGASPDAARAPGDGATPGAGGPAAPDGASLREIEIRLNNEYQSREAQFVEREAELRRRILQLEADVRSARSEVEGVKEREKLLALDEGSLPKNLEDRMQQFDARERELQLRENELRTRFEEIRLGSEEIERKRAPLAFKERELEAWDQHLRVSKQTLEIEARRLEKLRAEEVIGANSAALADKEKQMDDLRQTLQRHEEELRSRESFLHQQMEALATAQQKTAEEQAEDMAVDARVSATEIKVRTGVRRLDDLVFGGLPKGSQVLLSGPAHTGKDVLARLFVAEGLKTGIPALWVVTDKTYTQIREEMTGILPQYPDFESRGLVRYIDLYSRSLGVTQAESVARLISLTDKGAVEQLTVAVNSFSQDLREKAGTYRMVFESISTLTAYLDASAMFRFLQPFVGRRKLDGAAGYYVLETGMHTDADLQTLEHMVDGSFNLKVDQLKTFLSVKGITDAQSRAWVGYTFSKKSFSLGSFSLDHIR
ncbi:MAG TPA: ATPase domain-containing protein [Thermoplasmata archaeon]|nr:ATPase domain-containing protein [Thermoplasmata archaeon]